MRRQGAESLPALTVGASTVLTQVPRNTLPIDPELNDRGAAQFPTGQTRSTIPPTADLIKMLDALLGRSVSP